MLSRFCDVGSTLVISSSDDASPLLDDRLRPRDDDFLVLLAFATDVDDASASMDDDKWSVSLTSCDVDKRSVLESSTFSWLAACLLLRRDLDPLRDVVCAAAASDDVTALVALPSAAAEAKSGRNKDASRGRIGGEGEDARTIGVSMTIRF